MNATDSSPSSTSSAPRESSVGRFIVDNPGPAITAVGILIYAIAGLAHRYFYGQFGVRPAEVGLTYVDIVAKAALGLGILLAVALSFTVAFAALNTALAAFVFFVDSQANDRIMSSITSRRPGRIGLVAYSLILVVSWIKGWEVLLIASVVAAGAIVSAEGFMAFRDRHLPSKPSLVNVSLAETTLQLYSITISTVLFAVGYLFGGHSDEFVADGSTDIWLWLALITLGPAVVAMFIPYVYANWAKRASAEETKRKWFDGVIERTPSLRVLVLALACLLLVVTLLVAALVAHESSRAVAHGLPREAFIYEPVHSPVTCVDVDWIRREAAPTVPQRALYLGEAGGTAVLYHARQGTVRLPAHDIVIRETSAVPCS